METVQLKKVSTDSATSFNAVNVIPEYEVEDKIFKAENFTRTRKVYATYRKWVIEFAILNTTEIDFLSDYATREEPQFIYDSTTYNVEVTKLQNGFKGATLEIIERTAMS